MVLTDLIVRDQLEIEIFSLDTGRLPLETYDLIAEVKKHYGLALRLYYPRHDLVEDLDARKRHQRFLRVGGTAQGLLLRAQGRAAATRAGRPQGVDHRSARAAGGDPRRLADAQFRRQATAAWKNSTRSPTGASAKCGPTSSSTRSPTTRCTTSSTRASAARRARGRSRLAKMSAPAAGGGRIPNRRNAACTSSAPEAPRIRSQVNHEYSNCSHVSQTLSHLDWLESEAIHIMREVAGQCSNPVLLFSGGKDSICMLRIAEKAFRPGRFPFPLMHIDTGHNYREVTDFRDRRAAELGERLIVRSVEDSMARGTVVLKSPTNRATSTSR
jgi:3'-phosphoadenosine 5'-phosphosulfate sulfotransferase (PAPS reductase)/FAD synthetase